MCSEFVWRDTLPPSVASNTQIENYSLLHKLEKHGFDFEHCAYMLSEFRALVAGHFAKESVLSVAHVELLKYLLSE